jgi:endonuclease III
MIIALKSPKFWKRLTVLLKRRYGSPLHGNKADPLDELIYIVLSAKTRIQELKTVYDALRAKYPSWDEVLSIGPRKLEREIRSAGLSRVRAKQIMGILRAIRKDRKALSLDFLRDMEDEAIESYLTALPGVGLKTARCVMLYSLGRKTFPVDVHTLRLFRNIGITSEKGRHDTAQDPLQNAIPKQYRYTLHINIVAHGREVCVPGRPKCETCVLAEECLRYCC